MPMATMFFMGLPVAPVHSPLKTFLEKALIFVKTAFT